MKLVIGIVLAVLIVAIGWFVYFDSQSKLEQNNSDNSAPTITLSPTTQTVAPNIPNDYLTHEDSEFSIKYHPKMTIRNEAPGMTSFVLVGPTQRGQTELYDGINFVVEPGTYTEATFREFVDTEVQTFKEDGTSQATTGVISVNIGNKTGYEFSTRTLGEVRQIYIEEDDKKYNHITLFLEDPSNAGFEEIVSHMLQSLTSK